MICSKSTRRVYWHSITIFWPFSASDARHRLMNWFVHLCNRHWVYFFQYYGKGCWLILFTWFSLITKSERVYILMPAWYKYVSHFSDAYFDLFAQLSDAFPKRPFASKYFTHTHTKNSRSCGVKVVSEIYICF